MTEIEIDGRKWPMRATIGAWKRFEETTGKKLSKLNSNPGEPDVQGFCELAFHFVVAGCKRNGTEFKMSVDEFLDSIEISDMENVALGVANLLDANNQKKQPAKTR
jgi:hypothetical protein